MTGKLVYWMKEDRERLRSVSLTLCCRQDLETLSHSGMAALRKQRASRLIEEARRQGARLSHKDLSLILLTSKSTLKRDLKRRGKD